jgi:DHA1 family bicyclomycin/chloramphenicol resistance-like MFS transporter
MGSFRMSFGALVSGAVSVLHNNTAIPMVGVMATCVLLGLLILLIGQRRIQYRRKDTAMDEPLTEATL